MKLDSKFERIIVSGPSASGKTILAMKLSKLLDLPIYHQDDFWVESIKNGERGPHIAKRVDQVTDSDRWVIDGGPPVLQKNIVSKSDLLIVIDVSFYRGYFNHFYRRFEDWIGKRDLGEWKTHEPKGWKWVRCYSERHNRFYKKAPKLICAARQTTRVVRLENHKAVNAFVAQLVKQLRDEI